MAPEARTPSGLPHSLHYYTATNHQHPPKLALYELQNATLGGIPGEGYAYPVDTYKGTVYRGVFFAGNDADLGDLPSRDDAIFEGTVYLKTSERTDEVPVDVTNVVNVAVGSRADFNVIDS